MVCFADKKKRQQFSPREINIQLDVLISDQKTKSRIDLHYVTCNVDTIIDGYFYVHYNRVHRVGLAQSVACPPLAR